MTLSAPHAVDQSGGMTRQTNAVGAYGEQVAARILSLKGMEILGRNCVTPDGELDIVARDGATIVFCEVKTRRGWHFGQPIEAVNRAKVRRLRAAALWWLIQNPRVRGKLRFDVFSVWPQRKGAARYQHDADAF
jgi:putative endonuclease